MRLVQTLQSALDLHRSAHPEKLLGQCSNFSSNSNVLTTISTTN